MDGSKKTTSSELFRALKSLNQATKKSKTFEIQHLIRKLKPHTQPKPSQGKKESKEIDPKALEADLLELKAINVEELAKKYLYTRLKRRSSELINDPIFSDLQTSPGSIQFGRIENKICSQKSLAEVIAQAVSKLTQELKPTDDNDSKQPKNHTAKKQLDSISSQPSNHHNPSSLTIKNHPHQNHPDREQSYDPEELSGDELDEAVTRELEALEEEDSASHQTSEEGEDDEYDQSDNLSDSDDQANPNRKNTRSSVHQSSKTLKSTAPPKNNHPSRKSGDSQPTSSTFLPTLNVGFTLGDSDVSDLDDLDDPLLDKMERERDRKNRRGQRARRAIWEKKYGKSAKHLTKLDQKSKLYHGEGRTTAASNNPSKSDSRQDHSRTNDRFKRKSDDLNVVSGANSEPLSSTKKTKIDETLHPSWIAKQKQLQSLSTIKPAGKKIVFS